MPQATKTPTKTPAGGTAAAPKQEESAKQGEAQLDELLNKHETLQRRAAEEAAIKARTPSPLEVLRREMKATLIPGLQDLQAKYAASGFFVLLDAENLLGGGRELTITIEYCGQGIRLEGIATDSIIAFRQTRYGTADPSGLTGSGPSLRVRGLDAERFREFVCERMASLVKSAMTRKG